MTNNPATPVPDSTPIRTDAETAAGIELRGDAPEPIADDAAPAAAGGSALLDDGTYDKLIEPRSPRRLALEQGAWHQISRKYLWVQLISSGIVLVMVVAAMLALTVVLHQQWALIPGGIVSVILIWTMAILPRQVRAIGYQLRQDDLVFRRGILWQRMVAVPYGRMQLVDITHGPLDRGFGIAQLKFVTAAATSGVTIPGLQQSTAETLRDHLVAVAESRRTGL